MKPTALQKSVFDGLMLSDAGLEIPGINARFNMTSHYRSFVDAAKNALSFLSWAETDERERYDKRTDKFYHSCKIRSHVDPFLTKEHKRWYPDGIKVVPEDLVLDRDVLEWWYLGDGHLERRKSRPNYRRIILATNSFSSEDREHLIKLLEPILGESVYSEDVKIAIGKQSMVKFAQMMIECPVVDYQYKYEFGNYINNDYHHSAMVLRGPCGGRPKGSKDKAPRRSKLKLEM